MIFIEIKDLMNQKTTILVVDDDPSIIELVQTSLEEEDWNMCSALNGDEALKTIHENLPDLVILDIMMPGIDGTEVCRHINSTSSVPVVMLTAQADLDTKVRCLEMGADDYITKPFQPEELIARVKAVLRRQQKNPVSTRTPFISEGLEIDFIAKSVRIQSREVRLTPTEYNLLEELVLNAGKTLTYKYLLNKVWGPDYSDERQYLHVYIGRLRTKIESHPKNARCIVSVPGVGYRFKSVQII